jgi:uracil-DNA glycosylase family 4
MEASGNGSLGVLILGEAMGDAEAREHRGFVEYGESGALLERAIRRSGFTRDQFTIWNAFPAHPHKNFIPPHMEGAAIEWGRPFLEKIIAECRPRCILAVGNLALQQTVGVSGIGRMRGWVLPSRYGPVVPAFHPAFIRRGALPLFADLMHCLKLAVAVANTPAGSNSRFFSPVVWRDFHYTAPAALPSLTDPIVPPGYITHPTEARAWEYFRELEAEPSRLITYDIETPRSTKATEDESDELEDREILSIQFSAAPRTGIFLPWREPFTEVAAAILALPNPKAGANTWRFDDPLLRAHGMRLNGELHDIRWAFHHLQPDMKSALDFIASFYCPVSEGWVPWKHLHDANPQFYGIRDVDAVQWILHGGLWEDLKQLGVWSGYRKYVVRLEPVLEEMSAHGLPVSPARHTEVKRELEQLHTDAKEAMQSLVPQELHPFSPKRGYKKIPKDTTNLVERQFPKGDDLKEGTEARWVRLLEWKPSLKNLSAYTIAKGHKVPINWKSGQVTFGEEELERLVCTTKDWVYQTVINYRQIETVLKNHVANWVPAKDGRVHPVFYYDTGTGQLASRRPNVQNAPKHGTELKGELADKFRSMVEAPPGYTLWEADYKAFHVMTLAFEAQDAVLARAGRLDVHSFVTAHLLRLPDYERCWGWDDAKLGDYLANVKKAHREVRDAKVKHAFLGYDNGMGYRKLYYQYREFFSTQAEAKEVMVLFDALFPRAKAYRQRICQQAHEQGYLISRFGCVRWFWEVFKKKGDSWEGHGEDHEAALSFLTQNDAHCHLKDAMLRLWGDGVLEWAGFCNTIHDNLMFLTPNDRLRDAQRAVRAAMEAPSPVLVDDTGALQVGVSISEGQRWNEMREVPCL